MTDPTIASIKALCKKVEDSGMTYIAFVRLKEQELEDLQDELEDLKGLSNVSPKLALTTPKGRRRRVDTGTPREQAELQLDTTEPPADGVITEEALDVISEQALA